MATIIFTLWGNVGSLAFFMERLRGFLGRDDETDLRDSIIDVYYEYNAPLPKDLVEKIPKTVFGSLENRD